MLPRGYLAIAVCCQVVSIALVIYLSWKLRWSLSLLRARTGETVRALTLMRTLTNELDRVFRDLGIPVTPEASRPTALREWARGTLLQQLAHCLRARAAYMRLRHRDGSGALSFAFEEAIMRTEIRSILRALLQAQRVEDRRVIIAFVYGVRHRAARAMARSDGSPGAKLRAFEDALAFEEADWYARAHTHPHTTTHDDDAIARYDLEAGLFQEA